MERVYQEYNGEKGLRIKEGNLARKIVNIISFLAILEGAWITSNFLIKEAAPHVREQIYYKINQGK